VLRYYQYMIKSFKSSETEKVFNLRFSRRLPQEIQMVARRRLRYLHAAKDLEDLRMPPGNQLEALKGNRRGQHSIRINRQWRICSVWQESHAYDVEIIDYH
jgi:toxin HigB-1